MAIERSLFRILASILVVGLMLGSSSWAAPGANARDIEGNTYTSPRFGYSVTWDNSWLVMNETSDDVDILLLTNGLSNAGFLGIEGFIGSGQLAATVYASGVRTEAGVSDYQIIDSGGDDTRYHVTISLTMTYEDGSTAALMEYIEARTVTPGSSVVIFDAFGPADFFEVAKGEFDVLLQGLTIPGAAPSSGTAPEPEPVVVLEKGEPGPVFMAGPWRLAVVAAAQGAEVPGLGLEEKDGKAWVVVVVDATNWGSSNPTFPAEDFFVQMVESDTQHKVASGSTASAGRELELPLDPAIAIEYGSTGRVVMVFSVNADRTEPTLVYRNDRLPLYLFLLKDMEADDLSAPAGPPDLQEATFTSVTADGSAIQAQYAGESFDHRLRLLGVDASGTPDAVVDVLSAYEGETIWIETDPAIDESATPNVYLWVDNEHGDRVLINQLLIEEGVAMLDPLPSDTRFGLWLRTTARSVALGD